VVLDFGFWGRGEREDYRARAAALGARTEVRYLDVPRDELVRRLTVRNAALPPDTFRVEISDLDLWSGLLEVPTPDELE
jgi:predicted kinase